MSLTLYFYCPPPPPPPPPPPATPCSCIMITTIPRMYSHCARVCVGMGVGGGGEEKEEWSPPYAPQHTVKPLNKGCIGNNINSAFMSFVERLSSSQRFEMYWNHRETNSLLGPWKVPFVERGLWSNVPILEGPLSDVYCNHNPSWWVWVPLVNSHISGGRNSCPHHLFSGASPSPTFAGNPGHQDCKREESCDNHITVTWSETIHFVIMLVTITLEPGSSFSCELQS